jgi:hypothetical protein
VPTQSGPTTRSQSVHKDGELVNTCK